jgi:cytochrome d ubiquinol oxidase subunit I
VAASTTLSAFWILALNSWMQTPTGHIMIDGVAHAESWLQVVFNPSMPYRLAHTLLSSGLTVAFLVGGLLAYRRLKGDSRTAVTSGLTCALILAAVLAPLQAFVGDLHGVNTRDYQPAKLAAMEAHWESGPGMPLTLFALPDEAERTNRFEVSIPKLGSLMATRDLNGYVAGLNDFVGEHPPVAPVFWGFRVMVGIGMLMIAVSAFGVWLLWKRKRLPPLYLKLLLGMTFSGWVATIAGWYVTEIGRQPWLVYGVLKTKDAVAHLPSAHVGLSFTAYLITYSFLLLAYAGSLFYLANKEMATEPREAL